MKMQLVYFIMFSSIALSVNIIYSIAAKTLKSVLSIGENDWFYDCKQDMSRRL